MNQDIAFDLRESVSLEGNSGPYLQYTVVRCQSVLAKARSTKHENTNVSNFDIRISDLNNEELLVLRTLVKFPEMVKMAAKNYSPNILCNYLFDLAQKYNTFYDRHRILGSDNLKLRLKLTIATGFILKNGLKLLGIETPEKM